MTFYRDKTRGLFFSFVESDGDLLFALQCPKSPLKGVFVVFIRDR
jgi:hypothetical protein